MTPLSRSARARFRPGDVAFLCEVLTGAREVPAIQTLLGDQDSFDLLLDNPHVLRAVLTLRQPIEISPDFYFFVLVRHALKEAGIDDRELTDYVAATLADEARACAESQDKDAFDYHFEYLRALRGANRVEQFFLNVRCGNRFLVLTGLFPRFLAHRERRKGAPGVRYYEEVARESFRVAARHRLAEEFDVAEVYDHLAERLPETRRALNRMAAEYLFLDGNGLG